MAGGSGRIRTGGGSSSRGARVENERLWVDAVISGGGGSSGNVTIIAPLPLPVDIQSTIAIPVTDNGGSLTVDGTVSIAGTVTIAEPVSVDDNGASLTVDGTVAVSSVAGTVVVGDGGGSITVDGTVSIAGTVTIAEPVSIDDNGGSLTIDGTVAVSSLPVPVPVTDNAGSLTVDGTVAVSSVAGTVTVSGTVAVTQPVAVTDNSGSLTVDGTVAVSSVGGTVTVAGTVSVTQPVAVTDNSGSLTVDGTVAVSSVAGTVVVGDGGGSITVDGTVAVTGTVSVTQPVAVTDNSGSLTVDGTVAVSSVAGNVTVAQSTHANLNATVRLQDGNGSALLDVWLNGSDATSGVTNGITPMVRNGTTLIWETLSSSNTGGLVVSVDSVTPGIGATSLGKNEDAPHGSADVGVFALAVRNDADASRTSQDGDYSPISVDSAGRLRIGAIFPGTAATNLGKIEDAGHTTGDVGVMPLAVRNDAGTALAGTTLDYIPISTDSNGKVWVTATVTDVIPGSAATNLGKAEDAVHASGDVGVMSLAVRQDTLAALAGTTGDYIPLTTDSLGRLNVLAKMVEAFTVLTLSSSTSGQPVVIDTTGFVTVHTVAASSIDIVTIYATNVGTTDRTIVVGLGASATGQQVFAFVPTQETVVVLSGISLGASQVIQAKLTVAGTVRVFGQVIRRAA